MTNDIAQTNLNEPQRTDWDNYSTGSKYQAPPPAQGPDGKPIVYQGIVGAVSEDKPDQGELNYLIDPITLVNAGPYTGAVLRFTRASVRPFQKNGEPMKGNPSRLGNLLRSAGLQAKPQSLSEWRAATGLAKGKTINFTIDWEAYNTSTQEKVKGFLSFPEDPERPGQRKSILKAGDIVTERDNKGNVTGTKVIESEVLFANARLRFFQDPTPKVTR